MHCVFHVVFGYVFHVCDYLIVCYALRGAGQAPPIFDQQAFVEAIGVAAAAIAQASTAGS